MNKLQEFLNKLRAKATDLRNQAEANKRLLGPLQQQEVASQAVGFFHGCNEENSSLIRLADDMDRQFAKDGPVEKELSDALAAERAEMGKDSKFIEGIRDQLVKDGAVVLKATADTMAETAKNTAIEDMKKQTERAQTETATITERRKEAVPIIADKIKAVFGDKATGIAQEVASAMSDDELKKDDWKKGAGIVAERAEKIAACNVRTPALIAHAAKFPLANSEAFDVHHQSLKEVSGSKVRTAPPLGGGGGGGGGEKASKALVF